MARHPHSRDHAPHRAVCDAVARVSPEYGICAVLIQLVDGGGEWRVRTGDYRIIYEIHDDHLVVLVIRDDHRREIYESR